MTTDEPGRTDPPVAGDELATLHGFLDYHRQTLRWKISGLTRDQLLATHPPSAMTLLGMVKHLALVEDQWFTEVLQGGAVEPWASVDWSADRDWDWHSAADDDPDDVIALWEGSIVRSAAAVAAASEGLDTRTVRTPPWSDEPLTLRWVLAHMLEEYARHNGHADLLREAIDGSVGD